MSDEISSTARLSRITEVCHLSYNKLIHGLVAAALPGIEDRIHVFSFAIPHAADYAVCLLLKFPVASVYDLPGVVNCLF